MSASISSKGVSHSAVASAHQEAAAEVASPSPKQRLASLDALRGFDMLWIIGLDGMAWQVAKLLPTTPWLGRFATPLQFVCTQLDHKKWDGMAFEDLIVPLFVFVVGVSIVFSLSKARSQSGFSHVAARIIPRSFLLYLFGLLIYNGFDHPLHAVRWLGVLQRIAICYCVTALLFYLFRPRVLVALAVVILIGYWLAMAYVNVPGVGRGSFAEGRNLANYIDQQYLGGSKYDGDHDPEGLLSTFPAIGTCLLGVFAGLILRGPAWPPYRRVLALILGGAVLASAGYAWGFLPSPIQFPIIKKVWTSSYVLLAGGYSAMLLGVFYLIADVWKFRVWATPFIWIGTNAITIYMVASLGFAKTVSQRLVGGGKYQWPIWGTAQPLVTQFVGLCLVIALARFLYRRKIFIRV